MAGIKGRSGGYRLGAGRKAKDATARALDGGVDNRRPQKVQPVDVSPLSAVQPPSTLSPAELAVWTTAAPAALAARTLIDGTADDFAVLCQLEVEMAEVLQERRLEGWSTRGLALAREYRGLVTRVENKRRAFRLAPMGREMVAPVPVGDDFAEFDGPRLVKGGA